MRCDGLTLVEVLLVLAISAVIISMSVLALGRLSGKNYLRASARDLAEAMRYTRRLALTTRSPFWLVFGPEYRTFWTEAEFGERPDRSWRLKDGICLADPDLGKEGEEDGIVEGDDPDDAAFRFSPRGTAEGGSVYLRREGQDRWFTVTVQGPTGEIRVYDGKH